MRVFIHDAQAHALGALVQRTCRCTFKRAASMQARMHARVHVRTPVGRLGLPARKRAFVQVSHVYMHVRSHAHILCRHTNMRARAHVVLHACTHVPVLHVFRHSVVRFVHDRSNSFRKADSSHNVQSWHVTCFHSHRHTHAQAHTHASTLTCLHARTPAFMRVCVCMCSYFRMQRCTHATPISVETGRFTKRCFAGITCRSTMDGLLKQCSHGTQSGCHELTNSVNNFATAAVTALSPPPC